MVLCLVFAAACSSPLAFKEKDGKDARDCAMEALGRHFADRKSYPRHFAVVDFSQPSCLKRMTIYDLRSGEKDAFLVAHAANTGDMNAERFSNEPRSEMSSLGLFRVGEEYTGRHGRSLRLHGLEKGVNDNAYRRGIVLHSAGYVSSTAMLVNLLYGYGPRIGRSNGCFVVSPEDIDEIVERLKGEGYIYAYSNI